MTAKARPQVTGVVLAGGQSRRFGDCDKLTAELEGQPLVERVRRAIERATGRPPLFAVQNSDQQQRLTRALGTATVRFVRDTNEFTGPLAGLAAAVAVLETPWIFVCAGDMPLLSPAAISWLWTHRLRTDAAAIVPRSATSAEPLHALYRRRAVAETLADLDPDAGPRSVVDRLDAEIVPAADSPPFLAQSLTNVNTEADLERASVEQTDLTRHI